MDVSSIRRRMRQLKNGSCSLYRNENEEGSRTEAMGVGWLERLDLNSGIMTGCERKFSQTHSVLSSWCDHAHLLFHPGVKTLIRGWWCIVSAVYPKAIRTTQLDSSSQVSQSFIAPSRQALSIRTWALQPSTWSNGKHSEKRNSITYLPTNIPQTAPSLVSTMLDKILGCVFHVLNPLRPRVLRRKSIPHTNHQTSRLFSIKAEQCICALLVEEDPASAMDMHEDTLRRDRCSWAVWRIRSGTEVTAWNIMTAAGWKSGVGPAWEDDRGGEGGFAVPAHLSVASGAGLRISLVSHYRSIDR